MVYKNKLYIAYVKKTKECKKIIISYTNLNEKELSFNDFLYQSVAK